MVLFRWSILQAAGVLITFVSIELFVWRYLCEALLITLRSLWDKPFFYYGDFLSRVMSCMVWVLTGSLIFLLAKTFARFLPKSPFVTIPMSLRQIATFFSISGFILTITPIIYFLSEMFIYAVKITLVGSWETEGIIFSLHYVYYSHMFLVVAPWILSGIVVQILGNSISASLENHHQ